MDLQLDTLMKRQAILFAIALLLGGTVWLAPPSLVRYGLIFVLLWLLPGLAWACLIPGKALDRAEWSVVALGLSFVITPITTVLAAYLPGLLDRGTLLGVILGAIGLPLAVSALFWLVRKFIPSLQGQLELPALNAHPEPDTDSFWQDGWAWLLVAVLIAVGLRVINLDYSEFQGDEAVVMVRAANVLEGDDTVLFQHKKGPAELTLVMAGWRLAETTNEWMARLPFAWASVLGVVAVFLFGRRLDRPHAGGIAACLLAIEGYRVGFGRIVQYQSLVFALSTLGLLCLLIYYSRGNGRLVIVAAAFFAGGTLAHYDALLVLPAGLLLVGARLWRERRRFWYNLAPVLVAGLVGGVILALFYVPFLRSPYLEQTSSYVSGRVGGDQLFYNNLRSLFELSAVYNSVYLLALMALALAGQVLVTWARWGRAALVLAGVLLLAALGGLVWPDLWVVNKTTLAWVPSAVLLIGALLAPGQSMGLRAVWLWLGVPALFYLFFVALPLTHIHMIFPAWAMLAGIWLVDQGRWLASRSRPVVRVASVGAVVAFFVCSYYVVMLFVDHTPEYRRTFPEFKHPLFWTPYQQMPQAGLFGFPYRAGWKVVGHLVADGGLTGTFDSNEEQDVTDYYMHQAVRLSCASPDFYITAVDVQDKVNVRWDQIEQEYQPAIVVTVGDQPKITIHERDSAGPLRTYQVEEYAGLFDSGSTPDQLSGYPVGGERPEMPKDFMSDEAVLGSFARLLGYRIDARHAAPGGYVELTLLWQVLGSVPVDYHVFTHLHDGEMMRAQLDGQPVCGSLPTSRWRPGQYIVDPYRIPIEEDAPPGLVPLTIGMYDFATMQRLPVSTSSEPQAGDSVHLTDVEIQAP